MKVLHIKTLLFVSCAMGLAALGTPTGCQVPTGTLTVYQPDYQVFSYREDYGSTPFAYSPVSGWCSQFTMTFQSTWSSLLVPDGPNPPLLFAGQLIRYAPDPDQFQVWAIEPRNIGLFVQTTKHNGPQSQDQDYVMQYDQCGDIVLPDGYNTTTISKLNLQTLGDTMPPGIYGYYWSVFRMCGSCGEAISGDVTSWGRSMDFQIDSATVNDSAHTVTYTCRTLTAGYSPAAQSASYKVFDRDLKQVGSGVLNTPPSTTTISSAAYSRPGPYYFIAESLSGPKTDTVPLYGCTDPYSAQVTRSLHCGQWIREAAPRFEVTQVSPSTVEPVYGDELTISWHKTYSEFYAKSIVLLDGDGNPIQDAQGNDKYVVDLSTGTETENTGWNAATDPWRWSGEVSWALPQDLAVGKYCLAVRYTKDDGSDPYREQLFDEAGNAVSFSVGVSAYDVYSFDSAPFYPGDDEQGTTTIHYKLSDDVQSVTIEIGDPVVKTITDNTHVTKGDNVVPWDGKDDAAEYVDSLEPLPIQVKPVPTQGTEYAGRDMDLLVTAVQTIGSTGQVVATDKVFAPDMGETLCVKYKVSEPVKRTQVSQAYLTAVVYDESGQMVRVLSDTTTAPIIHFDNDPTDDVDPQENSLIWDGKEDASASDPMPPGDYTITLLGEDKTQDGCQSAMQVMHVALEQGREDPPLELGGSSNDSQSVITGYASPGASVTWSDSRGGSGTVTADGTTGDFEFTLSNTTPGQHTITASLPGGKQQTYDIFVNSLTLDSAATLPVPSPPSEDNLFLPEQGGSLSVNFTTACTGDTFDVRVFDPFSPPGCIGPTNPVPGCTLLNGQVRRKEVKTVWSARQATAGQSAVSWDGTDSVGNPVPSGPYIVEVSRTNADYLRTLSFEVVCTVGSMAGAPSISGIRSLIDGTNVRICWDTDVAAAGAVLYQEGDHPVARVPYTSASTSHLVYLPDVKPNTTYNYWITAVGADGKTAVSAKQTMSSGSGYSFDQGSLDYVSDTSVDIGWRTETATYGRVFYCDLRYPNSWSKAEMSGSATDHLVHLTNLSPNIEYAYRVEAAGDWTYSDVSKSNFGWFVTEQSKPSVEIASPTENQGVSGTISVNVQASDTVHRFNANGITDVELYVDGEWLEQEPLHTTGSSVYTFGVDTSTLNKGFHELMARATDDYWNSSSYIRTIYVGSSGIHGAQEAAAAAANVDRSKKGAMPADRRNRDANTATILVGEKKPMSVIFDEDYPFAVQARQKEAPVYKKRYKLRVMIYFAERYRTSPAKLQHLIVKTICLRRAFTYAGHGVEGQLTPITGGPTLDTYNFHFRASELHWAIGQFKLNNPSSAGHRLSWFRLFTCRSGEPEQGATLLLRDAMTPYYDAPKVYLDAVGDMHEFDVDYIYDKLGGCWAKSYENVEVPL